MTKSPSSRTAASRRHGGRHTSTYDYDDDDRLTRLKHHTGGVNLTTPTIDLAYGYDPEGLRTQTENAVISDRSEAYGHDNRQRLTQMRRGVLSTGQDGTPMVADEDLLVHDKLAAAEQWVGLDRRGNWRDYREEHKSNASTDVIRRETREASGSNAYTSIDPEAPDIQEDPPPSLDPVTPTYDAAGNLRFDPLARVAGQPRNLTSDNFSMGPGQEFGYDEENRVVSIHRDTTDAGGPYSGGKPTEPKLLEFVYDALGRRVETKEYVDAATGATSAEPKITRHVYVGLENIQDWTWNSSASPAGYYVKQQYLWGDEQRFPEPVAMLRPFNSQLPSGSPQIPANAPGWHYLHDVLGSVIGIVDDGGNLVERYTYDPYGKVFVETWNASANENQGAWEPTFETNSGLPYSPLGNPWLWTGQRYDAAVGLYAFWARTYSPMVGRWLQRDPIEYEGGSINLYEYVIGNVLRWIDSFGFDRLPSPGESPVEPNPPPVGGGVWQPPNSQADSASDEIPYIAGIGSGWRKPNSKTLRKIWEQDTGQKVPWDPKYERPFDISHKQPVADGGDPKCPKNLEPMQHDEHMKLHKERGDFIRWGKRAAEKVKQLAIRAAQVIKSIPLILLPHPGVVCPGCGEPFRYCKRGPYCGA